MSLAPLGMPPGTEMLSKSGLGSGLGSGFGSGFGSGLVLV